MGSEKGMTSRRDEGAPPADVEEGGIENSSVTHPDVTEIASSSTSLPDDKDCDFLRQPQPLLGRTTGPKRRSTKGQWTPEEDEILYNAVRHYQGKNWKKIAECFPDRTDVQCLHRWQKVLNPALVKGPWSKEEDEIIVEMVKKVGPKKWSTIAQALPGRIGKQCRERWHNHLNPTINKDAWTQEEEIALIRAHQIYGNKWAELTKFLPGRSDNSIKNHWNSSVKKKLESIMFSDRLSKYPDLPNMVSSSTTSQQKIHNNGSNERPEMEDSSESSSSALVVSQSKCEMAKPLPMIGDKQRGNAIRKEVADSHLTVYSSEYCGPVEVAAISSELPEVSPSGKLLQKDEGSGNAVKQSAQIDSNSNHEEKAILLHKPALMANSTSNDAFGYEKNNEFLIPLPGCCIGNLSETHFNSKMSVCNHAIAFNNQNLEGVAASLSCKSDIHNSGTFMSYVSCSCHLPPVSTSDMFANSCCQSLMTVVPPSFVCPGDNVDFQDNRKIQYSGSIGVPYIGFPNYCCSFASIPELKSSCHEHVNQQKECQVEEEKMQGPEETLTSCDDPNRNLSLAAEQKVASDNVLDPGVPSLEDEEKVVQSEKFLDSGFLFYEPPRIQSLEFPFVSCDIVPTDLQAYSPLGIQQLLMSSSSCNFWDSPDDDDSPDEVLKHAAKSFICTPSILKKRQRELLSPLQERRYDKKSGTDKIQGSLLTSFTKGEACADDMMYEAGSERISLYSVDDVLGSSYPDTARQNVNPGDELNKKNISKTLSPCNHEYTSGANVPSDVNSDAKEPRCGGVLVECNNANSEYLSGYSSFSSPAACGSGSVLHRFSKATPLQYPPSSKKPQVSVEKFTPSTDANLENLNIFADTPSIKRGLDSPSAWKSPWFLSAFLPGADMGYEDLRYFMSPDQRNYDALGLMKQLNEQSAPIMAEAQELLCSGGQKLDFDIFQSNGHHDEPAKELENLPMYSNIEVEGRALDFSSCATPIQKSRRASFEKIKVASGTSLIKSPTSHLLRTCR